MNKTERYQHIGFFTYYNDGVIEKTLTLYREYGNFIILSFCDGTSIQVQVPLVYPLESYHIQFGITVSLPFRVLFVQSWERGLCCIDIDTSDMLWEIPKKHAYEVYAVGESVYAHFVDDGLYNISIITGQCNKRYPYTTGGIYFLLPDFGFLIGPHRKKYVVLDFHFCKRYSVPVDSINPDGYEVFLIHDVDIIERQLYICGMEFSSAKDTETKDCESMKFKRYVPLENFKS